MAAQTLDLSPLELPGGARMLFGPFGSSPPDRWWEDPAMRYDGEVEVAADEAVTAAMIFANGEVREQLLVHPECKPLARAWRATAVRRAGRMLPDFWTSLALVPSSIQDVKS